MEDNVICDCFPDEECSICVSTEDLIDKVLFVLGSGLDHLEGKIESLKKENVFLRENNEYLKMIVETLKKEVIQLERNLDPYKGRY